MSMHSSTVSCRRRLPLSALVLALALVSAAVQAQKPAASEAALPAAEQDEGLAAAEELIRRVIRQRALRQLLSEQVAVAKIRRELDSLQQDASPANAARPTAPQVAISAEQQDNTALKVVGTWQRNGEHLAAISSKNAQALKQIRVGDELPGMAGRLVVSRIDTTGVWVIHPETGHEISLSR